MARFKTKEQFQAELVEANEYIEELEGKLDDIAGIANDDADSEDDGDDCGAGDEDDGE